jgi:pectate lyase
VVHAIAGGRRYRSFTYGLARQAPRWLLRLGIGRVGQIIDERTHVRRNMALRNPAKLAPRSPSHHFGGAQIAFLFALAASGCGGTEAGSGPPPPLPAPGPTPEPAAYRLTVDVPKGGTITGATSGASYPVGAVVTLAASTDGTYGIKAWTGDARACGNATTCAVRMNADSTVGVLFKTVPVGFGAETTGGQGGAVVTVTTPDELKAALCDTVVSGGCADATPRIIQIASTIDFRGSEGFKTSKGCTYSDHNCSVNGRKEEILDVSTYCSGKVTYDITYDAAGPAPMRIGSNKTLIGVGASAGIKGKGVMIAGGVSNVIVRNLSITDINEGVIWAGDAITIDNASKVWIDHNYIARIGRQMIVTGWGTAANVTISNNFLDGSTDFGHYCDGRHYWMMLFLGEHQSITLVGNKIYNTSGRSPELGKSATATDGGTVHVVNNLYDRNYNMGIRTSDDVTAFIEGNYFASTGLSFSPIRVDSGTNNLVYAPLKETADVANADCSAVLGRGCSVNFSPASSAGFTLNPGVMPAIRASSKLRLGIGSIRPFDAANVPTRLTGHVGPQPDPDN